MGVVVKLKMGQLGAGRKFLGEPRENEIGIWESVWEAAEAERLFGIANLEFGVPINWMSPARVSELSVY
jgi:hypothetical protein